MEIFFFILVLIVSFIIGIFGFCQIVGSLKYFKPNSLITIIFWLLILSVVLIVVANFLNDYLAALIIGYVISFLLSFTTKPDNDTPTPLPNSQQKLDLSILSEEDRASYELLEDTIESVASTLILKASNIGCKTFESIEQDYLNNRITKEEYENDIKNLQEYNSLKDAFPKHMQNIRSYQNEILARYNMKI